MDPLNALLQSLGLSPVTSAQGAMGLAAQPQQDYNRIQKLMEFLRNAQNYPQFQAAKGAVKQTGQDVQSMMGQAGTEVNPLLKQYYQKLMQGALPLGKMFNEFTPPMSPSILNQMLPGLLQAEQGPQG